MSKKPWKLPKQRPGSDDPVKPEHVNHPDHYGGEDNPYEVIKVLRAWFTPDEYRGFLKGNTIKYNARARMKGGQEDYRKAKWYQDELVRFEAGMEKSD